jgi:hypothetical protein
VVLPLYSEEEFQYSKGKVEFPLRCLQCNCIFHRTKRQIIRALDPNRTGVVENFCSRKCVYAHQITSVEVQCLQCGVSFDKFLNQVKRFPNHFCSHPCSARYNNTHKSTGARVSKLEIWLQEKLPKLYSHLEFHFNRKDAINGELDIYIPNLKLAFELNGIFHYEPIYGPEKLASIRSNDDRKIQACLEHGIEMCIIDVSRMTNFKEKGALIYLQIIQGVMDQRLGRKTGIEPAYLEPQSSA